MKIAAPVAARLVFLCRVTEKECVHLLGTDQRLFGAWLRPPGLLLQRRTGFLVKGVVKKVEE